MLVLLVDDHPFFVHALANEVCRVQRDARTVTAGCIVDALHVIARDVPDLVILDLALPDAHGVQAIDAVAAVFPANKIVGFSGENDPVFLRTIFDRGVLGYIPKATLNTEFALREVLSGRPTFPPLPESPKLGRPLTDLELAVARMANSDHSRGSTKVLATTLGRSERAIWHTWDSIKLKLGASTKTQALAKARRLGLI